MSETSGPGYGKEAQGDRPGNTEAFALRRLLGVLSESRWLILGITVAVLAIALVYSFLRTPVYRANTVIQVAQKPESSSGLSQIFSLVQGSPVPTDTEIELLQTRSVLVPAIEKLHLNIRVGGGHGLPVIGSLFGSQGGASAEVSLFTVPTVLEGKRFSLISLGGDGYRLSAPDGSDILTGKAGEPATGVVYTASGKGLVNIQVDAIRARAGQRIPLERIPMAAAVSSLRSSLTIAEVGSQSGLISISMQGGSPQRLALELNAIAQANLQHHAAQSLARAASQLKFVKSQLPAIRERLESAQKKLVQFLDQHEALVLSQNSKYLEQKGLSITNQITPVQAEVAAAESVLGAQSPKLLALKKQLEQLEQQRRDLYAQISQLPADEQTMIRLQAEVNQEQALYSTMLNQGQSLQIAQMGAVGDVTIVDAAIVPSQAILPNRRMDALTGLIVGLLLGIFAAYVRRALRHGVEDPEVIEERLGLPVYSALLHSRRQRRLERARTVGPDTLRLLAADEDDDRTLEGLRSLRTSLQLTLPEKGPRILTVSSLGPGEGKTFVASNLAYLFALGGWRVLLVDADLRRGHLHRLFGWKRECGLTDLLEEHAPPVWPVRDTGVENFYAMTTGRIPRDATNLLTKGRISELLTRLGGVYDLVIVDVPPLLAVGDALVTARCATTNLLLLKYGTHSLHQIRLAMKRFDRHGIELLGCVLNDVPAAARRYAYREYGYRYQYRYKTERK